MGKTELRKINWKEEIVSFGYTIGAIFGGFLILQLAQIDWQIIPYEEIRYAIVAAFFGAIRTTAKAVMGLLVPMAVELLARFNISNK